MPQDEERTCAGWLLLFLDFVNFLVGASILGFGIYVYVNLSQFSLVVSSTAVYAGLGIGGALMLIAIWGCVASERQHKCMQYIYFIVVFALLVASVAVAILAGQYLDTFSAIGAPTALSSQFTSGSAVSFNNGLMSVYTACCYGCLSSGPAQCTSVNLQGWMSNLRPPCNVTAPNSTYSAICTPAVPCGTLLPLVNNVTATGGCYTGNPVPTEYPTSPVDLSVCTTFGGLTYNNSLLVGPAQSGGCGGGNPQRFIRDMTLYAEGFYYGIRVALAVFCGLQALTWVMALAVCCGRAKRE